MRFRPALSLAILLATFLCGARADGATAGRLGILVAGGKSITSWHGQADLEVMTFEFARPLSDRTDLAFAVAPVNLWQPRSWFGDQYGDGNENVRALSASLLLRRRFNSDSRHAQWYLEGGTGPMWAERRVPASTSRFNFITQAGAGVILWPKNRISVIAGYRFHHISNGGYSPRNPGLNVSALVMGLQLSR
jgi:hypothetical protein